MQHSPLGSARAPDRTILPRTCNASDVGSRAVNDTIPERGVCANANEERHSGGQHVAVGIYNAVQKRAEAGTGDGCYFPVGLLLCVFYFILLYTLLFTYGVDTANQTNNIFDL